MKRTATCLSQNFILILFFIFFTLNSTASAYTCDSSLFKYTRKEVATWKIPFPIENTNSLPFMLYWLYDAAGFERFHEPYPSRLGDTPYMGYVFIDKYWEARFIRYGYGRNYRMIADELQFVVDDYNNLRPKEENFEVQKEFFDQFFLNPGKRENIFILGKPGEFDEDYIPILDSEVQACARKRDINSVSLWKRLFDREFSLYRPVNLKPGMRVLVPEPPDNLDEIEAQRAKKRQGEKENGEQ